MKYVGNVGRPLSKTLFRSIKIQRMSNTSKAACNCTLPKASKVEEVIHRNAEFK